MKTTEFLQNEVSRISQQLEKALQLLDQYRDREEEARKGMKDLELAVFHFLNQIEDIPAVVFTDLSDDDVDTMESWFDALKLRYQQQKEYHLKRREDILAASVRVVD